MQFTKKKWLWSLVVVVGLLATALAVPFLVPISGYIPELTRLASEKLGQPVEIKDLRLELLPTPRIAVLGLRLGRKGEVSIERGSIVPEWLPLLAGETVVRVIRAEKVHVKESALNFLDKMRKGEGGGGVAVRRIVLRDVKFEHRVLTLPEFDVEVLLSNDLSVTHVRFSTRDGALRATLDPESAASARLALSARNWRLPVAAAPLAFEALDASGVLKGDRLELPKVDAKLYGGTLAGSVGATWGRQWRIAGKADVAGVDVVPLQAALGKPARLSGRLSGKATFSMRARAAGQLGNALVLDAPFEVAGGEWHGVDLSRVAELPLGKLSPGGTTQFEQMKGDLALRGQHVQVNEICVRSPVLVAAGNVAIAPDQTLSGKLDVSVAKTKGFVGVPVALSGTTADRSLSLTKAGAIGAVIGTVLLPGIGTSLGLSAGSSLEGKAECK